MCDKQFTPTSKLSRRPRLMTSGNSANTASAQTAPYYDGQLQYSAVDDKRLTILSTHRFGLHAAFDSISCCCCMHSIRRRPSRDAVRRNVYSVELARGVYCTRRLRPYLTCQIEGLYRSPAVVAVLIHDRTTHVTQLDQSWGHCCFLFTFRLLDGMWSPMRSVSRASVVTTLRLVFIHSFIRTAPRIQLIIILLTLCAYRN